MIEQTIERLRSYLRRAVDQVPESWRLLDAIRELRGKGMPRWEDWCFVPTSAIFTALDKINITSDKPIPGSGFVSERHMQAAVLFSLGTWRITQGIYRFDETIMEELWRTPVKGNLPAEILLRLPEWCCYIETPGKKFKGKVCHGFFVGLDWGNDRSPWLRLTVDHGEQLDCAVPIPLVGTIEQGINVWLVEARKQQSKIPFSGVDEVFLRQMSEGFSDQVSPLISMVLYLCAQNADIPERSGTRPQPVKTKKGTRFFPPDQPRVWECGYRVGAAIRKARQSEGVSRGGTHASPRPHIRTAHWHSFWTGKRTAESRELQIKWLPPIPVNVDLGDPLVVPTIHKVWYDVVAAGLLGLPIPERREFVCHACSNKWRGRHPRLPERCPACKSTHWNSIHCPACDKLLPTAHVIQHLKSLGAVIKEPETVAKKRPYMVVPGFAGEFLLCGWCDNWLHETKFGRSGTHWRVYCRRCDAVKKVAKRRGQASFKMPRAAL